MAADRAAARHPGLRQAWCSKRFARSSRRSGESYGDPRRTEIIPETDDITIEDMIADEDMVITVTQTGYVKRSPLSLYRAQHRGGKGRKGMLTKDDDFVEHLYVASAHSYILVFTEQGRVHWLKVHEIPQMGPASKGKAIVNLLNLEQQENVATTVAVRDFPEDHYLIFATEKGTIKKTPLSAYSNPRSGRHHRDQDRRGRSPAGCAGDGWRQDDPAGYPEGLLDPLLGAGRSPNGSCHARRPRHLAAQRRQGGRDGDSRTRRGRDSVRGREGGRQENAGGPSIGCRAGAVRGSSTSRSRTRPAK